MGLHKTNPSLGGNIIHRSSESDENKTGKTDALNKSSQSGRSEDSRSQDGSQRMSCMEMIRKWPKVTFCIIGNEFCERFSFYGMRAVLTLYVMNILQFSSANATILFHAFIVICYTSPIIGSILADGYFGKFWTILSLSLFYAAGETVLAVSSTFHTMASVHPYLDICGLLIIAFGTGGIKPCVSAFGGDQFNPRHTQMISVFFSIFYFSINAGSTISMFLTPLFRSIPCHDQDSCYPLAFGVPAGLMILATIIFVLGSKSYKKYPPKENVIARVTKVIITSLRNKVKSAEYREHWLDHALDGHNCTTNSICLEIGEKKSLNETCAQRVFVEDVKALLRVTVMLLPIPMFWALYDQQGSKWVLQAVSMDSRISSNYLLLPDQMSVVNAILIMFFIPIFQFLVYPAVEKCGIRTTPLRRMVAGGVVAALAFVIAALVQFRVNYTLPDPPSANVAFVSFSNVYDRCNLTLSSPDLPTKTIPFNSSLVDDEVIGLHQAYRINVGSRNRQITFTVTPQMPCTDIPTKFSMNLKGGQAYQGILTRHGFTYNPIKLEKPKTGQEQSLLNVNLMVPYEALPKSVFWANCSNTSTDCPVYSKGLALCKHNTHGKPICDAHDRTAVFGWPYGRVNENKTAVFYTFKDIDVGTFDVFYISHKYTDTTDRDLIHQFYYIPLDGVTVQVIGIGAMYSLTIQTNSSNPKALEWNMNTLIPANEMNILWQIPQYVVITAAEILISITGLEFAYSQAPPTMKSVVQAIWLMTVAVGDLIIIIIELLQLFNNLAIEMLVYAGVMLVVICIFALQAAFYYHYVDYADSQDSEDALTQDSKETSSRKELGNGTNQS